MKAWQLLKHLEEGGVIRWNGHDIRFHELSGWDYDPIRNPDEWTIVKETT